MLGFIILLCFVLFLYWGNNSIVVSKYKYSIDINKRKLNGIKILHISDFHNKKFGSDNIKIIDRVKYEIPDIIVITGDIIDRRRYDLDVALSLGEQLSKIAPSYYVSGNHEAWSGKYETIKNKLKDKGIVVLEDNWKSLELNGEKIEVFGIKENMEKRGGVSSTSIRALENYTITLKDEAKLSILLAHRPELFDIYKDYPFDLIFTGHAHGGQIRLPLIGALFAPDQGLIPKYHGGRYNENNKTMFLSRGLGNSIFPLRILNRPELVLVEFEYTT